MTLDVAAHNDARLTRNRCRVRRTLTPLWIRVEGIPRTRLTASFTKTERQTRFRRAPSMAVDITALYCCPDFWCAGRPWCTNHARVFGETRDRSIGSVSPRACKILGEITRPLIELDYRWRTGSPDNDGGRHPRASRSAPQYERRGRAARSSCSSASVVSCSCAWPRSR